MSHILPLDETFSRLSELFTINQTYYISFDQHRYSDVLVESRKSKGKDQDKKVTKVDGKLVPCWILKFESFEAFIDLTKLQKLELLRNGVRFVFKSYTLDITSCE